MAIPWVCSWSTVGTAQILPKNLEYLINAVATKSYVVAPAVRHAESIEVGYQNSIVGGQVGPIWITALALTRLAIGEVYLHNEEQLIVQAPIARVLAQDSLMKLVGTEFCCAALC